VILHSLSKIRLDVGISNDLTQVFKPQAKHTFTIKVFNVLSCRPAHADEHFVVPIELQPTYNEFIKFYRVRHAGRSLRWLWNYSSHELTTNYLNETRVIVTSAYQAAILLLYNRHDSLSVMEIVQATGILKQVVLRVLAFLQSAQILIKREDCYDLNFGGSMFL
jgi:cullin 1